VAGEDLDSSLIVPLIKRAEPEGAGGSSPLSWPEGDTPIAEELAGELYVFYGFDLPGAFRLVSRRDQIAAHPARAILAATPRRRAAIDPSGSLRTRLSRCTTMADLRRAQGRVQLPGDCEYSI
jgi:hypothetical protein